SPDKWADVKKRLPLLVKKRHYRNTRYGYARGDVAVTYVDNIRRYYDALVWLDENDAMATIPPASETKEQTIKPDEANQRTSDEVEKEK
ncbi:MAG: lytic transglycosylase F, partial [Pseudoalteromonas tetraodonis]